MFMNCFKAFCLFLIGNLTSVLSLAGQDVLLQGLSREDSLFFFKHQAELIWGHDRESADFFAQHSGGDYFILNLKTQKIIIQSPDMSRKQQIALSGNDLGLWNTIEQPFFEENGQMCLISFGFQYYFNFIAGENKWEVQKVPVGELVKGFREVKVHRLNGKNMYVAGWGTSTAMRPNGVFAQAGEIDFDEKKITPLLNFKIKKDPIRYVGFKKFQAFPAEAGLLMWVQFEKKIYITDEKCDIYDTLSMAECLPDADFNYCILLRDEGRNRLYFWAKSKKEEKVFWTELIVKDKKITTSKVKILPSMYPVYLRDGKLFLSLNTSKDGKLSLGNDGTHLMIYAMRIED